MRIQRRTIRRKTISIENYAQMCSRTSEPWKFWYNLMWFSCWYSVKKSEYTLKNSGLFCYHAWPFCKINLAFSEEFPISTDGPFLNDNWTIYCPEGKRLWVDTESQCWNERRWNLTPKFEVLDLIKSCQRCYPERSEFLKYLL